MDNVQAVEQGQARQQAVIQVMEKPGRERAPNAKWWATEGQMRVVANVQACAGSYVPQAAR